MTSRLRKSIAITCLVSLIVASIALAENEPPTRRGGRDSQMQRNAPSRYMGSRSTQQPGGGRGMGGPSEMGMSRERGMGQELIPQILKKKLNLTDEQNGKVNTAQDELTKKSQILTKKHQDLKQKLDAAVNKSDKEAVVATAQEMGKAIGESALLKISQKDILKGILNEKQMKSFENYNTQRAEMREKMRKQMEERMRNRGEGSQRNRNQNSNRSKTRGTSSPRRSR